MDEAIKSTRTYAQSDEGKSATQQELKDKRIVCSVVTIIIVIVIWFTYAFLKSFL